jgi:DNA-binding CsgD family transcriptional regulator
MGKLLLVRDQPTRAFFEMHRGYKIKLVIGQAFGQEDIDVVQAIGGRPLHSAPIKSGLCLLGLTREQALSGPETWLASLFMYSPPRFSFTPGEQELLVRALDGSTDAELVATLNISLSAVKKRWSSIFGRVSAADTALFPAVGTMLTASQKRGRGSACTSSDTFGITPRSFVPTRPTSNRACSFRPIAPLVLALLLIMDVSWRYT